MTATQSRCAVEVSDLIEQQLKMLADKLEVTPSQILTGVHNAFSHGEIFANVHWTSQEDLLLEKLIDSLHTAREICQKIEDGE